MSFSPGDVLDVRTLNRTLLSRQHLLERDATDPLSLIDYLLGLQGQLPVAPYIALWTRISSFDPTVVSDALADRRLVRLAYWRSTLHLVSAEDCVALRQMLSPALERTLMSSSPFGKAVAGIDMKELLAQGRALLEEQPLGYADLGRRLQERFPSFDATSLAYNVHYCAPLVQVTPRGLWRKSGAARLTTAESWLGRELAPESSWHETIRRYLRAFGPASVADAQSWSGARGLRQVFEELRPELITYRSESGTELFDLPDGPIVSADVAAPVRYLPEYDNIFLGHADRARIVSEADRRSTAAPNGVGSAPVLVDGFISGIWRFEAKSGELTVHLLRPPGDGAAAELQAEGEALVEFLAPGVKASVSIVVHG